MKNRLRRCLRGCFSTFACDPWCFIHHFMHDWMFGRFGDELFSGSLILTFYSPLKNNPFCVIIRPYNFLSHVWCVVASGISSRSRVPARFSLGHMGIAKIQMPCAKAAQRITSENYQNQTLDIWIDLWYNNNVKFRYKRRWAKWPNW